MIFSILLIIFGLIVFCYGWYIRYVNGYRDLSALGKLTGVLLSLAAVLAVYWASVRLDMDYGERILLLFGIFLGAGLIMLFREWFAEGFSSIFHKNKSDAIFYALFLLALIVILVKLLQAAFQ